MVVTIEKNLIQIGNNKTINHFRYVSKIFDLRAGKNFNESLY